MCVCVYVYVCVCACVIVCVCVLYVCVVSVLCECCVYSINYSTSHSYYIFIIQMGKAVWISETWILFAVTFVPASNVENVS